MSREKPSELYQYFNGEMTESENFDKKEFVPIPTPSNTFKFLLFNLALFSAVGGVEASKKYKDAKSTTRESDLVTAKVPFQPTPTEFVATFTQNQPASGFFRKNPAPPVNEQTASFLKVTPNLKKIMERDRSISQKVQIQYNFAQEIINSELEKYYPKELLTRAFMDKAFRIIFCTRKELAKMAGRPYSLTIGAWTPSVAADEFGKHILANEIFIVFDKHNSKQELLQLMLNEMSHYLIHKRNIYFLELDINSQFSGMFGDNLHNPFINSKGEIDQSKKQVFENSIMQGDKYLAKILPYLYGQKEPIPASLRKTLASLEKAISPYDPPIIREVWHKTQYKEKIKNLKNKGLEILKESPAGDDIVIRYRAANPSSSPRNKLIALINTYSHKNNQRLTNPDQNLREKASNLEEIFPKTLKEKIWIDYCKYMSDLHQVVTPSDKKSIAYCR